MECKDDICCTKIISHIVEIDTLWNVKQKHAHLQPYTVPVEIDTLWNVKSFSMMGMQVWDAVEIDTLWNVKLIKHLIIFTA